MAPGRGSRRSRVPVRIFAMAAVAVVAAAWLAWEQSGGGGRTGARQGGRGQGGLRAAPVQGARAPGFRTVDGEGNRVRLSDYRGRPLLVNFWATWCVSCAAEMPAIQATLDEHQSEGFEVLAVNVQGTAEDARRYLEDLGVDFRLLLDPDGAIARRYRVLALPASFFVDRWGVIRRVWQGEMTPHMVEEFTHLALRAQGQPERSGAEPVQLTVLLEPEGPGTLYLLSPAIRCDRDYCADQLLAAVHVVPAVTEARPVRQPEGTDIPIFVRFDPAVGGPEDVVAALRRALRESPDPLFRSRLAVQYLRPVGDGSGAGRSTE